MDRRRLEGDDKIAVTWMQPKNREDLLRRLADARDLSVPERERENLCACAYTALRTIEPVIADLDAACTRYCAWYVDGRAADAGAVAYDLVSTIRRTIHSLTACGEREP